MPSVRARRPWERADIALVAVAILAAVFEVARAPRWTADDAYIVARYADHLAHHGLLAFNLEGPRVEGFTSPLFALLAVAASLLGLNSVHVMTVAGVAAYVGSGLLLLGLARELRAPAPAGGIVAFLYLELPEHVVHATSGLETEAYLAAELACALAFARGLRLRRWRAFIATCLVASLLRPEGIALSAVLRALAAWRERADRARFLATTKSILAGWVTPMSALLALRIALFHALLPNSYYAKRGALNRLHLSDLVALADRSVVAVIVVSAGIALLSRFLAGRSARVSPRWSAVASAAFAIVLINSAAYARSVLLMNYARRFAMHTVPWLAILALGVVALAVEALRRLRREAPARAALLGLVGLRRVRGHERRSAGGHEALDEPLPGGAPHEICPRGALPAGSLRRRYAARGLP